MCVARIREGSSLLRAAVTGKIGGLRRWRQSGSRRSEIHRHRQSVRESKSYAESSVSAGGSRKSVRTCNNANQAGHYGVDDDDG